VVMKLVISALWLLGPAMALAASPFDGKWKLNADSMKVTGKADQYQVLDGVYTCASCDPQIKVKADGNDQPVNGHSYYDTVAVVVQSPSTIQIIYKLKGKQAGNTTLTAANDGRTLDGRFQDFSGTQVASGSFTETRRSAGPPGSHAVSGSWQPGPITNPNAALSLFALEMGTDHFAWQWNGQSYNARFDGKEVPVHNDPGGTTVRVKRINDRTVDETDSRQGRVTDEIRYVVSTDGQTIEVTDNDVIHHQITTYTLERQT
jgi:hypothetical protein